MNFFDILNLMVTFLGDCEVGHLKMQIIEKIKLSFPIDKHDIEKIILKIANDKDEYLWDDSKLISKHSCMKSSKIVKLIVIMSPLWLLYIGDICK